MIGVVRKFISTLTLLSVTNGFSIDLNDNELNDGTTKNVTGPLFLNIFDSISNLTMDIDVLFDEFQEGFDDIKAANSSEEENTTEVDDDALNGSSIVVGLFDTLRDITEDVGDVVTDVGEGLVDKRPEFIEVTQEVDKKITKFGGGLFSFAQSVFQRTKDLTDTIASTIHRRTKWQE